MIKTKAQSLINYLDSNDDINEMGLLFFDIGNDHIIQYNE